MKRILFLTLAASLIFSSGLHSQDILKKVGKAVTNEILGNSSSSSDTRQEPEPTCACNDAELVVNLGGSLKLDYKETNISTMDDGSILLQDRVSGNFYIARNGATEGPFMAGDARIAGFESTDGSSDPDQLLLRYKKYISKSGDKYVISFGGKTYGPYSQVSSFAVSRSNDKFAAIVVENIVASEMDGNKMEQAMKNAKSDQERMQLAMQYSQQMTQKMMAGGGPASMTPKLVSNVADASYDMISQGGASPNSNMKFDDILFVAYNKVYNLQGQQVVTLKNEDIGASTIFVKSSNNGYAVFNYGTLTLSDGKSYSDLFNPHLIKTGGQVYLAYMYYSPKRNALMQCRIPF